MRTVFQCKSDEQALSSLYKDLKVVTQSLASKGIWHRWIDKTRECDSCHLNLFDWKDNDEEDLWNGRKRTPYLHTAIHSTVRVTVVDLICRKCGALHIFYGKYDDLFCAAKEHVITREGLSFWVSEICGMGTTFRQAFSSFVYLLSLTTVQLDCKGNESICNRRFCSSSFRKYLSLLQFASEGALSRTFHAQNVNLYPQRMKGILTVSL